jgi:hypothetical protein
MYGEETTSMDTAICKEIFSPVVLDEIWPASKADRFFEALLGDSQEGAYDMALACTGRRNDHLAFEIRLHQRPGKCLACHLTYGLPAVFQRHPVIDIKGVVKAIEKRLKGRLRCSDWSLGATQEISPKLHVVPLFITVTSCS